MKSTIHISFNISPSAAVFRSLRFSPTKHLSACNRFHFPTRPGTPLGKGKRYTTTTTTTKMATSPPTSFDLYTYFRSSCAGRLRIALNLKNVPYESKFVNLLQGAQHSAEHKSLNPTGTVPVLVAKYGTDGSTHTSFPIGQSMAALEFLEESGSVAATSERALLPPASDAVSRARVRTICNIVACDVQPVTNLRIQKRVKALDADATAWSRELTAAGFEALEATVRESAGKFCVGDQITLADVCLVPAVWAAQRIGVELDGYPVIKRVFERMLAEDAVQKAHWKNQPDTPEDLRS